MQGDIRDLGARDVGGIIQRGGTVLQTARYPDFAKPEVQQEALEQLRARGIDALVAIGGDGTMRGALALHRLGFPVMGIPASIDNDVYGTDIAIGVDTALNTIVEAIDKLRDTASSHRNAFIVETMGRHCGHLALMSGIISGAEMTLIPEQEASARGSGRRGAQRARARQDARHHRRLRRREPARERAQEASWTPWSWASAFASPSSATCSAAAAPAPGTA